MNEWAWHVKSEKITDWEAALPKGPAKPAV